MNDNIIDQKMNIVEFDEHWTQGGRESYVVNLVKEIDKNRFNITILTSQKETDSYDRILNDNKIKFTTVLPYVYKSPIIRILKTIRLFRATLPSLGCDVLHLHIDQGVSLIYAYLAKKVGIRKVIAHCHNSNFGTGHRIIKRLGHELGKRIFSSYVDVKIACSEEAMKWLYTKKDIKKKNVQICKYLIDVECFAFNIDHRIVMRKRYNIEDDMYVFLHVGRFHYQKNHFFLLRLFNRISEVENAILFLVGEGELKPEIEEQTRCLGLDDRVVFVGQTDDVSSYMSMADAFIFPSLYEGNPITVTEAQISGLPCFISDQITQESKILETTRFIPVNNIDMCIEMIIKRMNKTKVDDRMKCKQIVKNHGYDTVKQKDFIEKIYCI